MTPDAGRARVLIVEHERASTCGSALLAGPTMYRQICHPCPGTGHNPVWLCVAGLCSTGSRRRRQSRRQACGRRPKGAVLGRRLAEDYHRSRRRLKPYAAGMSHPAGPKPSHLPRWAQTRAGHGRGDGTLDGAGWRFRRAAARIEPAVTTILVDHATGCWQRPLARREVGSGAGLDDYRVVWTIDGQVVLEFRFKERGPSTLVVHDFSLFDPLRRAIRSRHVRFRFATATDIVLA